MLTSSSTPVNTLGLTLENLPAALRSETRWVCWRFATNRNGKLTKVPYQTNGDNAKSTDPRTWGSFADVTAAAPRFDGIGFVLGDGFAGVDLDHCRDPETGALEPWAAAILERFDSYAEASPSGTGVHIMAKGSLPPGGRKKSRIELYETARYFCVTGNILPGVNPDLTDQTAALAELHAATFGPPKIDKATSQKQRENPAGANLAQPAALPAEKLAALCENSDTFRKIWDGTRDYASQSEKDLALAGIMLEANFSPAEVGAVLCENRRLNNADPQKALRPDYIRRTLAKAREGREAEPVADLGDDLRQALGALPATDAGNAEALALVHGADLRFDATPGRERWLRFLGHLWEPCDRGHLKALALDAVRTRRRVADGNSDLRKFCAGSESRARISALLDLAESRPPIYTVTLAGQVPVWDRDRDLLGASNGIIDLTTGHLRPGEREDYITRRLAGPYSPTAPARRWLQFLQEVFGSDDLISYVQKAVGYSLFGTVSEQVFFLCIGPGANGKTQFLSALRNVLGDYAHAAPFSLFDHGERGQHPQALAQLEGRRFVTASESAEGCRLNEDRLKSLAGGEPITAHLMRENDRTFENTAAIWLGVNNYPRVVDESEGFWRKARVIPFTRCFKPQEIIAADADLQENPNVLPIDPDLAETLNQERAGILRWAVEGAVAWHREGLSTPAQVRDASGRWRDSASELGEFFATRCILGHRATVGAAELYAEYCEWALAEGIAATDRLSQTAFGARLAARFDRARRRDNDGNRIVTYTGVGLRKT